MAQAWKACGAWFPSGVRISPSALVFTG